MALSAIFIGDSPHRSLTNLLIRFFPLLSAILYTHFHMSSEERLRCAGGSPSDLNERLAYEHSYLENWAGCLIIALIRNYLSWRRMRLNEDDLLPEWSSITCVLRLIEPEQLRRHRLNTRCASQYSDKPSSCTFSHLRCRRAAHLTAPLTAHLIAHRSLDRL